MTVAPIPDDHHVVRHCKNREVIRENGRAIGIFPTAFTLRPANPPTRPKPETYFSTVYYEHFSGTPQQMMQGCCNSLAFTPKKKDAMARLNVAGIKEVFKRNSASVRITHEGKTGSPAYSAIRPGKMTEIIAAMLASSLAIIEVCEPF